MRTTPLSALDEFLFFLAAAGVGDVVGCAHGGLVVGGWEDR
jgi:hypothetical protein